MCDKSDAVTLEAVVGYGGRVGGGAMQLVIGANPPPRVLVTTANETTGVGHFLPADQRQDSAHHHWLSGSGAATRVSFSGCWMVIYKPLEVLKKSRLQRGNGAGYVCSSAGAGNK